MKIFNDASCRQMLLSECRMKTSTSLFAVDCFISPGTLQHKQSQIDRGWLQEIDQNQ
jgi:hypothetical protein